MPDTESRPQNSAPRRRSRRVGGAGTVANALRFEEIGPLAPGTWYVSAARARDHGLIQWMFNLTKTNMQELYDGCPGWHWDDAGKLTELEDDKSRFLVAASSSSPQDGRAGFVHLRFDIEDSTPVVYVYEIQIEENQRGKQLGRKLMLMVESLATRLNFSAVMLTVFSSNKGARAFYSNLGYQEDRSSPEDADAAGYLILSKVLPGVLET
jgi:ribosomal protein S18 acetylase RimI-like enzyme